MDFNPQNYLSFTPLVIFIISAVSLILVFYAYKLFKERLKTVILITLFFVGLFFLLKFFLPSII